MNILCNLEHRGAVGADPRAGDGAGILVQIPHAFFARKAAKIGFQLPEPGQYAIGALFMPKDTAWRKVIKSIISDQIREEGFMLLGWRDVPSDNSSLGVTVKPTEPYHMQVFIGRNGVGKSEDDFERRLYILRKSISQAIYQRRDRGMAGYYPVSLSCRTVIYKGMFLADQLGKYYPDLHEEDFESALALVHQRFSTNTFPTWSLAHPYRMIAHNGEINTLRGNVNWMAARQASVSSDLFGEDINKLWPISYEGQSDTACFDNALEFLVQGDAGQEPSLQGVARAHSDRARGFASCAGSGGIIEPHAARSPAGLRLHAGRLAHPDVADGDPGRGGGRLDGQRRAHLGTVRQA